MYGQIIPLKLCIINLIMLLEADNISFAYDGKQILSGVSLSAEAGELIIIGGQSGSGKTTLLRLFNRLNDPQSGQIFFNGRPLHEYKVVDLRRDMYYLQQTPVMVEGTVKDNLLLPFTFHAAAHTAPPASDRLIDLLQQFKLSDISLEGPAIKLSVGQKQRIAFIRAMLLNPKVMLLDEPISSLDPLSRSIVEDSIERMVTRQSVTIIMVTHCDLLSECVQARKYALSDGALAAL